MDRVKRLRKLLAVQEQVKALHEMRHAGFMAGAAAAASEAAEIAARVDAEGSLATLFPDVYSRRIDAALASRDENLRAAQAETPRVVAATIRTNMVERNYRDARLDHDRAAEERSRLDAIESLGKPGPAAK